MINLFVYNGSQRHDPRRQLIGQQHQIGPVTRETPRRVVAFLAQGQGQRLGQHVGQQFLLRTSAGHQQILTVLVGAEADEFNRHDLWCPGG